MSRVSERQRIQLGAWKPFPTKHRVQQNSLVSPTALVQKTCGVKGPELSQLLGSESNMELEEDSLFCCPIILIVLITLTITNS